MKKNKHLRNLIVAVSAVMAVVILLGAVLLIDSLNNRVSEKITVEDAQELLDATIDNLPKGIAEAAKYIRENTTVKVNELDYGSKKDIILKCSYETIDAKSALKDQVNDLLCTPTEENGKTLNATTIQTKVEPKILEYLEDAEKTDGEIEIYIYETSDKGLQVFLDDAVVDEIFGGLLSLNDEIKNTNTIILNGEEVDITSKNSLRTGVLQSLSLKNYDNDVPDTSSKIQRMWNDFADEFNRNFIEDGRWKLLAKGLLTTLEITALALVLGVCIGFIVAFIRCTCLKLGKLKFLDLICRIYLSIMRGTPVMVQLMIIYFVLLLPLGIEKFVAAVLCFGINSGAYVAEIVRGGIMAIDEGQTEAGRSLGLGYISTMWHIVFPQAFKSILPALANEFIALLKETSVAFYIGVADLTQAGLKIRSVTYSDFMPLIAIAVVYLILVLGLSYLVSLLERRLRKSDRS